MAIYASDIGLTGGTLSHMHYTIRERPVKKLDVVIRSA